MIIKFKLVKVELVPVNASPRYINRIDTLERDSTVVLKGGYIVHPGPSLFNSTTVLKRITIKDIGKNSRDNVLSLG